MFLKAAGYRTANKPVLQHNVVKSLLGTMLLDRCYVFFGWFFCFFSVNNAWEILNVTILFRCPFKFQCHKLQDKAANCHLCDAQVFRANICR